MKYVRGLDGLRGVAVIVVVLFHAQIGVARGGFLGVSLFFTLSGFLITSLLLHEHRGAGSISMLGFYSRRVRRLLPASIACVLAVLLAASWWSPAQQRALPGDTVAALANVANWRFAFGSSSYEDIFLAEPSPLAHFWSLAIEEQFYLLLPVLVVVALRRGRRSLAAVTIIVLVASVTATSFATDRDLIYNGTHTRAAELLAGALLAQVMFSRPHWVATPLRTRGGRVLAAAAVVVFGAAVVVAQVGDPWIYRGALPAIAVVSCVIIAAVVHGTGPARVFEAAPLVAVGAVSYGIYLYHWPIFLLLDEARTGLDGWRLVAVRCAVTGLVAVASYRLLEQPIRRGRVGSRNAVLVPAIGATIAVAVAVALFVLPSPPLTSTEELLALGERDVVEFAVPAGVQAHSSEVPSTPTTTTPAVRRRIVVVGSERGAVPVVRAAVEDRDEVDVIDGVRPSCPLSSVDTPGCSLVGDHIEELMRGGTPDVLVVSAGAAEDTDIDRLRAIAVDEAGMRALADRLVSSYREIVRGIEIAIDGGAAVLIYSPGEPSRLLDDALDRIELTHASVEPITRTPAALADTLTTLLDPPAAPPVAALRLLVIGDSTSLNVARALNDGSAGRLAVLWAGANGCPLAPVEAMRPAPQAPWRASHCANYDDKLPPVVADFDPDLVLVVVGPTELGEVRLPGDPTTRTVLDAPYRDARTAAMERIMTVVGPGVPVLVADVPPIVSGGFASPDMTDDRRLAALDAQLAEWDERWAQVSAFGYRGPLADAEAMAGSMRPDGVHPDVVALTELARTVLVDRLIDQTELVRSSLG